MDFPRKWFVFLIVVLAMSIGLMGNFSSVFAQGCSISSFTMTPTDPYTIGTAVILNGQSNCGTVRFEITRMSDNQVWHKAEIGTSNQTETWRTNETGSGNFRVCFVARGDGGWDNAARNCRTVYVEGSQAPPVGSQQGENVRCWVNNLIVTPSQGPVGHTFQMSGQGQCDGNIRAVRFTINGSPWGEFGGNTTSSTWNSSGSSTGSVRICFQATAGEWSDGAETCTNITLTSGGQPSNDVSSGAPATNDQPPQTSQSNPDGSTQSSDSSTDSTSSAGSPSTTNQTQNCNSISRLRVGDIAVVSDATPSSIALRQGPSASYGTYTYIPIRTQLTIIGGPSCSDARLVWWETQYDGYTGWVSETTRGNNYDLIPNGMPLPGSGSSPSVNTTSNSSCSGALSPTLYDGDRGRVTYTDGSATTMRDRPQGNVVAQLAEGTEFDVIADPTCTDAQQGHLWWVQVRTDSGQTGWVPFGYSGGEYWIEVVPQGSATQSSSNPTRTNIIVPVEFDAWNVTYNLEVNPRTCTIVNGAEIVSLEINRYTEWIQQQPNSVERNLAAIRYFAINGGGEVEQFRLTAVESIQEALSDERTCSTILYAVGTEYYMDMSGLGNIVFGYHMQRYRWLQIAEEEIASLTQAMNEETRGQLADNLDDSYQRDTGRVLGILMEEVGSVSTPELVMSAAEIAGLI